MEYLQGKEAVDSGASPVYGSMQVAGMVGQSVSKMGGLFQSLGEQGTEIAVQAAKADIRRKSNVMQLELSQKKAEYEANMLRNPNPEQWLPEWEKEVANLRNQYVLQDASEGEKAVMGESFEGWAGKTTVDMLETSTVALFQQDKQSMMNIIDEGIRTGDDGLIETGLASAQSMLGDEKAEALAMDVYQKRDRTRLEGDMLDSPYEILESIKDETIRDEYPGISEDDIVWARRQAKTASNVKDGDLMNNYYDMAAAGQIATMEGLEKAFKGKVPPRLYERMQKDMKSRMDDKAQALIDAPAYQDALVGRIEMGLSSYKISDEDGDEQLLDLTQMIGDVKDDEEKAYYKKMIAEKRAGQKTIKGQYRSAEVQQAADQLKAYYDKQLEAVGDDPLVLTAEAIEPVEGKSILLDYDKMWNYGYGKKQIKAIKKAYEDTPEKGAMKARELYSERERQANENLSKYDFGLLEAVRAQKRELRGRTKPEAKGEVDARKNAIMEQFGKANRLLLKAQLEHPKMDSKELKKLVMGQIQESIASDISSQGASIILGE